MSYKIGQLIFSNQQSTKERVNTTNGKFLKSQLSIKYNSYEGATSVKYDAFYLGNGTLEVGNGYIFSLETTATKIPTSCSIYIGYIKDESVTEISMNKMQWICDYNSASLDNVGIIKGGINAKIQANCIIIKHNENKFDKICLREISKIKALNKQEYERIGVRVPNNNHSFLPCIMVNNELITLYSQDQNIFYETTGNVKVQSIGVAYFDKNETDKSKVTSGIINNDKATLNKFDYYIDYLYKVI